MYGPCNKIQSQDTAPVIRYSPKIQPLQLSPLMTNATQWLRSAFACVHVTCCFLPAML